jgi:hypothetical protein
VCVCVCVTLCVTAWGGGGVGGCVGVPGCSVRAHLLVYSSMCTRYYFGFLRCLGLAWDTKRPGTKGTFKKTLKGGSGMTMNLAFERPPENAVEPIYGSASANFAPSTQRTNSSALAI